MEFDRVDALTARIEVMKHGRKAIGEAGMLEYECTCPIRPRPGQFGQGPGGPFAPHSLLQRQVARKQVVVRQRRRLIENSVCAGAVFHECDLAPGAQSSARFGCQCILSAANFSASPAPLCLGSLALLLRR